MTIAILLPFKENYTSNKAGAVSLFINDINNQSKFRSKTTIFGSTNEKKFLSSNYININIRKKIFKSSNISYVKEFLNKIKKDNTKIIEVHNRPIYIKHIRRNFKNNIFFYFHNDPITMEGSKTLTERLYLINNVDKLFFNSKWSQQRFFLNFENPKLYIDKTTVCYQSTNKVEINFKKKQKIISFVGKLNSAKGYDTFGKTIVTILDKYKDWKGVVIGDEKRENLYFKHKNLKVLGFKNNKFILNYLRKVSISIIPSKWDEPFGRTSLEAASRGSAVIISNKGGLPETSTAAIILKKVDKINLSNEVEKLINNKKLLLKKQKDNIKNFFLTHKYVSTLIDNVRQQYLTKILKFIYKQKNLKIMHITNFNYRFDGRLHYNTGKRLNNGLIRLGHNVLTISDRDLIHDNKTLKDFSGTSSLQKKIENNYNNFKPDLVILGHADSVTNETLNFLKKDNSKIAQWFLDPVSKNGPDFHNNKKRIIDKDNLIDATFLTTHPDSLDFKLNNAFYIPNPCDESFEILENYNNHCENDLFFAMSHGVHRGSLKRGKFDNRERFLNKLIKKNENIKFDVYGMNNIQPIWSDKFIECISNSSMALNLSRGKPVKFYSSDRIAQLIGNGLLTFVDERTYLNHFFSNDEVIFYKNIDDLSYKINKYKRDDKQRRKIAKNGKKFYFKHFNSTQVAEYLVEKSFGINNSKKFLWEK
jgi:glycosyltransferase involved in cell wall biosynthesis